MTESRLVAAKIITAVIRDGKTLDTLFNQYLQDSTDTRDAAFTRELCYGVARWYQRIDFFLDILLDKPVKAKDTDIKSVIMSGLYQLAFMRTPAHAAISESVNTVKHLDKSWAGNMVNAVLRRFQRESELLLSQAEATETARYSHPQWLIDNIRSDWPDHWNTILQANNSRPPMVLRVNLLRNSREDYLDRLDAEGITAKAITSSGTGVQLDSPVDVSSLPGFETGDVSVQDAGAQHASQLLDLKPGQRVLDACAAPGGKTGLILESEPALAGLTAVEKDQSRIIRLRQNCDRLDMKIDIVAGDVTLVDDWWDGNAFDRILLDAPCSGTGVIRRHPDIKIIRNETNLHEQSRLQNKLLQSVWSILNSRGKLVYATCSVLSRENDKVMESFLSTALDANVILPEDNWGIRTEYGIQTLPGIGEGDGFYYAVLEKQ